MPAPDRRFAAGRARAEPPYQRRSPDRPREPRPGARHAGGSPGAGPGPPRGRGPPADTVREIAAVLGIKYRRLADGLFNHSSVITLLDPDGVVLVRDEAIGGSHAALLRSLRAAQSAPSR